MAGLREGEIMRKVIIALLLIAGVATAQDASPLLQWVQAGAVAFSPLDVDDCSLWLDPSDSTKVMLNSGGVTNWVDKSAKKSNFETESGDNSTYPSYGSQKQNGLNLISFDGNQILLGGGMQFPMTCFFVLKSEATAPYNRFIGKYESTSSVFVFGSHSATIALLRTGDISKYDVPFTWGGSFKIITLVISTTDTHIYDSGALKTNFLHAGTCPINAGLGGRITFATPSPTFIGQSGDVLRYDRILTTTERQQVETYLKAKWGL